MRNRRLQWEALRLIVQLLPAAHRDTLNALLSFLSQLAGNAEDDQQPGNKMDAANLATIFAPNILHRNKPNETARWVAYDLTKNVYIDLDNFGLVYVCHVVNVKS